MTAPAAGGAVAADNAIEAELVEVTKHYRMGDHLVRALDGVSATFLRGEFWAIMGSSGSGKSTLLNLLGCLDRPTTGSYSLRGQDVSGLDDDELSEIRLRHIGFIFQSFNLILQSTVSENIQLPLYYQGWEPGPAAQRAALLAEKLGIHDRLDHRPMQLSGGQQQRVAIARALANDPALILADEPTANLDSRTSKEIMRILEELSASGKTILMVTHEDDIAAHAQKRMIMRDGRIDRIEER